MIKSREGDSYKRGTGIGLRNELDILGYTE